MDTLSPKKRPKTRSSKNLQTIVETVTKYNYIYIKVLNTTKYKNLFFANIRRGFYDFYEPKRKIHNKTLATKEVKDLAYQNVP
jgi:hypothetical protein